MFELFFDAYVHTVASIECSWVATINFDFCCHLLCPMFLPLLLYTYKFTEDNTSRHFSFKFDFAFKGLILTARAQNICYG